MLLKTYEWGDADAPPLVCIHGVGSHHTEFRHVAEDRWSKQFRVIAFDLRGHGYSGWEPPWDHATHLDDIVETVDALGLEAPNWVGHSFGGRLIFDLIARSPERVRRGVSMEPVIEVSPELVMHRATQELTGDVWDSLDAFLASRENTGADIDVELYKEKLADHFEALPDGRVRRRTCQPAVISIFSEFAKPCAPPETITAPTMLLYAPAFGLVTPAQRAAYEPYVEEVVEVPGLHDVFNTAYEETAAAVERFCA
ncbi:MAG: alpha/beta fold hydrolase [Verrucomicrobia bacterium]|nr:alpha/beta fold hydrolase [Verrucomicrobiota bacterium]